MTIISEAQIHFEFYRHIQNLLDSGFYYRGITFTKAEPEYSKSLLVVLLWCSLKKAQILYNKDGLTLDKRLYSIWPKDGIDPEVLLGILNSDLLLLMREIDGRVEEEQAMNRNSVMIYEANIQGCLKKIFWMRAHFTTTLNKKKLHNNFESEEFLNLLCSLQ